VSRDGIDIGELLVFIHVTRVLGQTLFLLRADRQDFKEQNNAVTTGRNSHRIDALQDRKKKCSVKYPCIHTSIIKQ
jgi:hypothetical protein